MTNKKSNNHVAQAHDKFFKMAMMEKQVAQEFFEKHLPIELLSIIDLTKLELQSGSYIDDHRQESIADILFKTMIGTQEAYLYLVVDHQSTPDVLMPFRVLKYICNIIAKHLNETETKKIPLILPLVVYHGRKPWNYSTDIRSLVDAPKELVEAYFLKPFSLIDLNCIEDEKLKEKAWAGVMELTLKHIFARDMQPYLNDIIELLKKVEKSNGRKFTEIVLTYILDRGDLSNKEAFLNTVRAEFSPEVGERIMTIAEQLKAEGIEKGIEKEKLEIAKRLLSENAEVSFIARVTELSAAKIEELKKRH